MHKNGKNFTPDMPIAGVRHTKHQFEYLARYQVNQQSFEEIAALYNVDVCLVEKSCREIADIVGLKLRDIKFEGFRCIKNEEKNCD